MIASIECLCTSPKSSINDHNFQDRNRSENSKNNILQPKY